MTERTHKLATAVKRALSTWMLEQIPREKNLITSHISHVELSKDLASAHAFISAQGDLNDIVPYLKTQNKQARHYLSQHLKKLRRIPQIHFHADLHAKLRQESDAIIQRHQHDEKE